MGIMVNTEDRDGAPWGMGHMGHGTHGQCGHVLDHVQLPYYCILTSFNLNHLSPSQGYFLQVAQVVFQFCNVLTASRTILRRVTQFSESAFLVGKCVTCCTIHLNSINNFI